MEQQTSDKPIPGPVSHEVARWLQGIPYEVAFWQAWYSTRSHLAQLYSWSLYDKPCVLPGFDIDRFYLKWVEAGINEPVVADVGCALNYTFGNVIAGRLRKVLYIDALAPFYNRILEYRKIDRTRISFGMVEGLTSTLGLGSAHFIHVSNALDHCADPMRGLTECLASLKIGGVLYTTHFINEAEAEQYRGFHQFNLEERQGHLWIWNREMETDVSAYFCSCADVRTFIHDDKSVVAVFTKRAELSGEQFDPMESGRYYAQLLAQVMTYFHYASHAIPYQLQRLWWTPTTRMVRMLPFGTINRIKKLMHKLW